MYSKKPEESKEKTVVDNSRLEELLMQEKTNEMKNEFLDILKDSRLFLRVVFRKNRYENAVMRDEFELKGQFGFDMDSLPDGDRLNELPLFTSSEIMRANIPKWSSSIVVSMRDLAEMLKQTDEYSAVAINPLGKFSFRIPIEEFLGLFGIVGNNKIKDIKNEKLRQLLREGKPDDEFKEILLASAMIVPCIDEIDGTSFVPIFDDEDRQYFQVFTDLDEYEKGMENDLEEIYPQAYRFLQLVKFANEYVVVNKASESFVFRAEDFK